MGWLLLKSPVSYITPSLIRRLSALLSELIRFDIGRPKSAITDLIKLILVTGIRIASGNLTITATFEGLLRRFILNLAARFFSRWLRGTNEWSSLPLHIPPLSYTSTTAPGSGTRILTFVQSRRVTLAYPPVCVSQPSLTPLFISVAIKIAGNLFECVGLVLFFHYRIFFNLLPTVTR
jgi:hypothetical protein